MKSLVLYYSHSGRTRQIARIIAQKTGADLREIRPETDYPAEHRALIAQAGAEIQNKYRPPLRPISMDWPQYEVVYLGTPNWCGTIAPPLASFLWEVMPTDKAVVPFCTHGGGGGGCIAHDIAQYCIGCNVLPLLSVGDPGSAAAEEEIAQWLKRITNILRATKQPK